MHTYMHTYIYTYICTYIQLYIQVAYIQEYYCTQAHRYTWTWFQRCYLEGLISTLCYSLSPSTKPHLKETSLPVFKACCPSSDPVVLNAQQEPHCPWFLMGVTTPLVLQSTVVGRELSLGRRTLVGGVFKCARYPLKTLPNSAPL